MLLSYYDLHAHALEKIYEKYFDQLCAVAAAILGGDTDLAQDAVQEAWLRLNDPKVKKRIDTSNQKKLKGLLLVTVKNTARNMIRGRREQTLSDEGWATLHDPFPGPEEQTEHITLMKAMQNALRTLSADDRDVLMLQYVQDFSSAEIAVVLGVSETAVRQRSHRARKRLRKLLQQEGYNDE